MTLRMQQQQQQQLVVSAKYAEPAPFDSAVSSSNSLVRARNIVSPLVGFCSIVPGVGASFVTREHQFRANSLDKTC